MRITPGHAPAAPRRRTLVAIAAIAAAVTLMATTAPAAGAAPRPADATASPEPTSATASPEPAGAPGSPEPAEEPIARTEERWLREQLDTGETRAAATSSTADQLLAGTYLFYPHPAVTLPSTLRWSENPLGSNNWEFQFHSLRWAKTLGYAWSATGKRSYLDRYEQLLRSWLAANPRSKPASPYAWNDHSTAWRAMTLVDFAGYVPMEPWLRDALRLHARVLADENFYVNVGNHALNQDLGLLAIGCALNEDAWIDLPRQRLSKLITRSIDGQGVTDEQAIDYQRYNYERYSVARKALEACGQSLPAGFERVERMPGFLAHATLPNGQYELIGDTEALPAAPIRGTTAEYASTQGASGPKPPGTAALFDAGYVFGRTGWGTDRPFADEVAYTLRFGPARRLHGHLDHSAVTLYGHGSRLLLDRGKYAYTDNEYRDYVVGRTAHNVVTVDGVPFDKDTTTRLSVYRHSQRRDHMVVRHEGYHGVAHQRRALFSRTGQYLIVHDELAADRTRRFRQIWHLPEGPNPVVSGNTVRTQRTRGNVVVRQLAGAPATALRRGARSPLQGWQSYTYGQLQPAPTVEAVLTGRKATYLTLLVPSATGATVDVRSVRVEPNGFRALVRVDGRAEGVVVDGPSATIVDVTTPLTDTFTSVFHDDIERLFTLGVAKGVTATAYDPGRRITRAQMATFLGRVAATAGAPLPEGPPGAFTDVDDTAHRAAIEALAAAGITEGAGDGSRFRPTAHVTRAQMASFIVRLQAHIGQPLPVPADMVFTDIAGSVHADNVRALAAAGITRGTGHGRTFDLDGPVTRGQMAALLHRHLEHLGAAGVAAAGGSAAGDGSDAAS